MPEIKIAVINKVPKIVGDIKCIVADNSDYTIRFTFDDMWDDGEKTVYFVRENGFAFPAAKTKDDTVKIPTQHDAAMHSMLFIGVQQGNVKTSRPVDVRITAAITDMIDDDAVQPDTSLWESVLLRIEELEKNGGGGDASDKAGKPVTITVDLADDNSFVIPDHTAEELLEMAQNGEVRLTAYRANEDGSVVVLMADIRSDSDTNDGVLYAAAADMQITSVPVLVLLNTNYGDTNGTIIEAPAAGASSSGGALNLQYYGSALSDITLSKAYTYDDVRAALLANRPITLTTYSDGGGETRGLYHVVPGASVSKDICFIGFEWTTNRGYDDEPLPDLGWTPRSAVLAEDGTLTFEDEWFEGYAKQAEVDSLSEAMDDLKQNGMGGTGLTAEQRNSLLAVINAIGTFNVPNGQELIDNFNAAWQIRVAATNITLDKSVLEFVSTASQMLTATVEPEDSTDTVVWSTSAPGVATVNNGIVTPVSDGSAVITATAGSVSASCTVSVEFAEKVVYYTITNNLTNCATDNSTVSVVEGGSYTATLTADDGYTLDGASVSVVVNGEDVTDTAYSDGVITIANVTGNVVITATAAGIETEEIIYLPWIGTNDGASYIDTEYVPESVNHKYLFGVQYYAEHASLTPTPIAGLTLPFGQSNWIMRVMTSNLDSAQLVNYPYRINYTISNASDFFKTGQDNYDSAKTGLRLTETPLYMLLTNGEQALYSDEEMTQQPTGGTFAVLSKTTALTGTDELHPLVPIYLGAINDLYANKVSYGFVKIYCFKVWDENDNLLVNMRPARKGTVVGMYDEIRGTFHANKGTGAFDYEEVSA